MKGLIMYKIDVSSLIRVGYDELNDGVRDWPTYDGAMLDRSKFVTSSEVNRCERRIKYGKQGTDMGFPNWGYAERGNVIEEWAVKMLRAADGPTVLLYAGDEQRSFYDGSQSGTPDGVIQLFDELILLEIKSVDPRTNYSKLPKADHLAQVQQNMYLVSKCLGKEVTHGILIYIDASNYQKRVEFEVEPDRVLMEKYVAKAAKIMNANAPEDLPATGMYFDECKLCDYSSMCSGALEEEQRMKKLHDEMDAVGKAVFK